MDAVSTPEPNFVDHEVEVARGGDMTAALTLEDERKIAAYDAARATVKIEGNTRAYYVLRAEQYEAALDSLEHILFGDVQKRSRDELENRAAEAICAWNERPV